MDDERKKKIVANEYEFYDENGNLIRKQQSESTPEIEELRKLRNECTKKADEYQKEIDRLFLEMYNTPDIDGKYVRINEHSFTDCNVYGQVIDVFRMKDGIRITLKHPFSVNYMLIGSSVDYRMDDNILRIDVMWDDMENDIHIITKEEFIQKITELNDAFVKSL